MTVSSSIITPIKLMVDQPFAHTGIVTGGPFVISGSHHLSVVVEGVGGGNVITVSARIAGQTAFNSIATITGTSSGTDVDVSLYDEVEFNVTTYSASGSPKLIVSSFFKLASGGGGAPTGPAGGVLSGTYPDPGFASDPTFTGVVTAGHLIISSTDIGGGIIVPTLSSDGPDNIISNNRFYAPEFHTSANTASIVNDGSASFAGSVSLPNYGITLDSGGVTINHDISGGRFDMGGSNGEVLFQIDGGNGGGMSMLSPALGEAVIMSANGGLQLVNTYLPQDGSASFASGAATIDTAGNLSAYNLYSSNAIQASGGTIYFGSNELVDNSGQAVFYGTNGMLIYTQLQINGSGSINDGGGTNSFNLDGPAGSYIHTDNSGAMTINATSIAVNQALNIAEIYGTNFTPAANSLFLNSQYTKNQGTFSAVFDLIKLDYDGSNNALVTVTPPPGGFASSIFRAHGDGGDTWEFSGNGTGSAFNSSGSLYNATTDKLAFSSEHNGDFAINGSEYNWLHTGSSYIPKVIVTNGGNTIIGPTKSGSSLVDSGDKLQVNGSAKLNGNLGVFNATPIAQPTTGIASSTYANVGAGSNVKSTDTFDGYTIGQITKALRNLGILA